MGPVGTLAPFTERLLRHGTLPPKLFNEYNGAPLKERPYPSRACARESIRLPANACGSCAILRNAACRAAEVNWTKLKNGKNRGLKHRQ